MNGPAVDDGHCFACGPHNPEGLHLRFAFNGPDSVRAQTTLGEKFQGYRGVAHGGIVMMLLDEAMAHASGMAGQKGMTAAISVRFRRPVPLGVPLTVVGTVLWKRRTVLGLEASVLDEAGAVLATAEGSFVSTGPIAPGRLGNMPSGETV